MKNGLDDRLVNILGDMIQGNTLCFYLDINEACMDTIEKIRDQDDTIQDKKQIIENFNEQMDEIIAKTNKSIYLLFKNINKVRKMKETLLKEIDE
jgi:uncharacterized protein Yka (UPF0111/DUF47 family)